MDAQPAVHAVFARRDENVAGNNPEAKVAGPHPLNDVVVLHDLHIPEAAQSVVGGAGQVEALVTAPAGQAVEAGTEGIDGEQGVNHVEFEAVATDGVAGTDAPSDVVVKTRWRAGVGVDEVDHRAVLAVLASGLVHLLGPAAALTHQVIHGGEAPQEFRRPVRTAAVGDGDLPPPR